MAVLTIFFRNGDYLRLGRSLKYTRDLYDAILASQDDLIEAQMFSDDLPRFIIRKSEVAALSLIPADDSVDFYSSAFARAGKDDWRAALALQKLQDRKPPPRDPGK